MMCLNFILGIRPTALKENMTMNTVLVALAIFMF